MNQLIVEFLQQLDRRYEPDRWYMPEAATDHRRQLRRLMETDQELPYPHQFTYPAAPVGQYLTDLRQADRLVDEVDDPRLRHLAHGHLDRLRTKARALLLNRDQAFSDACRDLDGLPSEELVVDAEALLATPPPPPDPRLVSADELAERVHRALSAYGLDTWSVTLDPNMAANMSVNGTLRRLRIRADAQFSEPGARRLVVHEVGGHVLRWENSRRQPEPLAALPFGRTVATEEGMALIQEARADLIDPSILRIYAARVVAVHLAQHQGITSVARTIATHIGTEAAIDIAIRVKRGLANPEHPGGTTKDYSYLHGLRVLSGIDTQTIDLLHSVKWSVDSIDLIEAMHSEGRLNPGPLIPDLARLIP